MTKHYPQEFRDDVVKVARLHQISRRQVAFDFGISAATLYQWLQKAEMKDGLRDVIASPAQLAENRELRRRNVIAVKPISRSLSLILCISRIDCIAVFQK
jgi:transposase-like protein